MRCYPKVGVFYFSPVQVENECVDTLGADDIDIMSESMGGDHSTPGHPIRTRCAADSSN